MGQCHAGELAARKLDTLPSLEFLCSQILKLPDADIEECRQIIAIKDGTPCRPSLVVEAIRKIVRAIGHSEDVTVVVDDLTQDGSFFMENKHEDEFWRLYQGYKEAILQATADKRLAIKLERTRGLWSVTFQDRTVMFFPGRWITDAAPEVATAVETPKSAVRIPESRDSSTGSKILIADENRACVAEMARHVRAAGFEPLVAFNGAEAVDVYGQHKEDVRCVMMDLHMPVVDGFVATNTILEDAGAPPVLGLSSDPDRHRARCMDMGFVDVARRPRNSREVLDMVDM